MSSNSFFHLGPSPVGPYVPLPPGSAETTVELIRSATTLISLSWKKELHWSDGPATSDVDGKEQAMYLAALEFLRSQFAGSTPLPVYPYGGPESTTLTQSTTPPHRDVMQDTK